MPSKKVALAATAGPVNPLKDAQRLRAAMDIAAAKLVDEIASGKRQSFRPCDFSRAVLGALGYHNFAYNDTGSRVRLHKPSNYENGTSFRHTAEFY